MMALIADVILGIISILTSFLPVSPFAGIALSEDITNYLGWLNWLVPIGRMSGLFGAWLLCAIVVGVLKWVFKHFDMFSKGATE